MSTDRKFCAFTRGGRSGLGIDVIPPDGFCISVFLVIRGEGKHDGVLMGMLNPDGPWDHIGALDRDRVKAHAGGWMLPSCHLMYGEAPDDCARRVAREQLGLEGIGFSGPSVHSEVYAPRRFPERKEHWDLEFIYTGFMDAVHIPRMPEVWRDLRYIEPNSQVPGKIARSHEDILSHLK